MKLHLSAWKNFNFPHGPYGNYWIQWSITEMIRNWKENQRKILSSQRIPRISSRIIFALFAQSHWKSFTESIKSFIWRLLWEKAKKIIERILDMGWVIVERSTYGFQDDYTSETCWMKIVPPPFLITRKIHTLYETIKPQRTC